jgi:DNA-binding NarL/FixJ family response regulator
MSPRRACGNTAGMGQATPTPNPLRVFLAEDSALIRQRLETMIAAAGAATVGQANNSGEAIRGILDTRPELVILDIQLKEGSGFDVLRAIYEQAPDIDIYLFSNFDSYPYRQLAERLGARGVFDKCREFENMRDLIAQRAASRR